MAGVKITALNPLGTADDADVLVLVDVSDVLTEQRKRLPIVILFPELIVLKSSPNL